MKSLEELGLGHEPSQGARPPLAQHMHHLQIHPRQCHLRHPRRLPPQPVPRRLLHQQIHQLPTVGRDQTRRRRRRRRRQTREWAAAREGGDAAGLDEGQAVAAVEKGEVAGGAGEGGGDGGHGGVAEVVVVVEWGGGIYRGAGVEEGIRSFKFYKRWVGRDSRVGVFWTELMKSHTPPTSSSKNLSFYNVK